MRIQSRILCLLLLLLVADPGYSQSGTQSVRKYSNEFLKIGVGARAAAMGNAFVGIANDATAGYWNPAGLSRAKKSPELALMHSEYFAGIAKYDYAGFTMPIDDKRRFGASIIRLGVDDIANTLNLVDQNGNINFSAVESFSVADLALLLSLSQDMSFLPGLTMGGNLKVVNRNVGKFATAWGFGVDLGAQYKTGNLSMGLMLSDVTSTFNAWTFNTETFQTAFEQTGNIIPENSLEITLPAAKFGLGYQFFENKKLRLLVAMDNDFHFDGKRNVLANVGGMSYDPHMGVELDFKQKLFLRGGFKNLQKVPNDRGDRVFSIFPTLGAGFSVQNWTVDYALSNVGNFSQTLYSHVFSLKYNFGKYKSR
jgi:hypothetical protein